MALLDSTNLAKCAIKKASAFGTESDIASGGIFLYASKIAVNSAIDDYIPTDVGTGGKRVDQKRLNEKVSVNITCNTTATQGWLALFSSLMGTESTPTETTVGQSDYLVTMDLADTMSSYFSLAYKAETDETRAVSGLKIHSAKWVCDQNGNGTWDFQGIGDTFIKGVTNTAAKIDALTPVAYESLMLGGANAYFRYGAFSTGTALTSTNNLPIMQVSMELSRPLVGQWGLRGALTGQTLEPKQQGDIQGTVMFKMNTLDRSQVDLMNDWRNAPIKMAEIFFDGSQIGTGINRSIKMQFPYLQSLGQNGPGQDIPGQNQFWNPALTLRMLKSQVGAPAGMTGVTDYMRLTSVQTRSTKWTA